MVTNREIFNEIAGSWYGFRHWTRFSIELTELAQRWEEGRLLNVGCAHGPDFLPFKEGFDLCGIDFSVQMVKFARKYASKFDLKVNLAIADALSLPYHDNSFDWAIAVATYHHIQGDKQRLQAFYELRRVMKSDAEVYITVWNKWQPGFWLKGKDIYVAWKSKDNTLYRYYYLFSYNELGKMLNKCGFQIISMMSEKSYNFPINYFSRNICILAKAV